MATRIRRHLSFANVISLTALMVVLGGAAYAVVVAPKNSVTSKSVRNETLKGKDIKDGKVTGAEIKNDSLKGADVDEGSLGEVPKAAKADTATSANTATSADTATSANTANSANTATSANTAANADAVDGKSAVCPAATVEHLGWCYDSNGNPQDTFLGAMDGCNAKGGNLPSLGQLRSIRDLPGIDLSNPDIHWVDAPFQDGGGANRAMTFSEAQVVDDDAFAAANAYRCVYPLVR